MDNQNIKSNHLSSKKAIHLIKENVKISEPVKIIGNSAFKGKSKIRTVKLPKTLDTISSEAFAKCTNLKDIYIPDTVEMIGKNAFLGLVFSDLFLPDTIQHIEETAFWGCSNLRNIYVPSRQFDRIHNIIPLYIRNKVSKDNLPF